MLEPTIKPVRNCIYGTAILAAFVDVARPPLQTGCINFQITFFVQVRKDIKIKCCFLASFSVRHKKSLVEQAILSVKTHSHTHIHTHVHTHTTHIHKHTQVHGGA